MEELLKELEHLSDKKKIEFIKDSIKQKRKYLNYLVARKNCYHKQDDNVLFDEVRKEIRKTKKEIDTFQELKNKIEEDLIVRKEVSHTAKKKTENKLEITLTEREINLLNNLGNEDHFLNLTHFDNIEISLLEHLLSLKQKYQFYLKKENKTIKNLNKSINLLNDLASVPKKIESSLKEHQETKRVLSKIIRYLDKLIKLAEKNDFFIHSKINLSPSHIFNL